MNNRKEPLIPQLGVITDIRAGHPRCEDLSGGYPGREKALFPSARAVRHAFNPRRRRSDVFDHVLTDL